MELKFQKLNRQQLEILMGFALQEGWNPGPHDADAFWAADPDGFYGYFNNNEIIGGGSLVSYDGSFGFMGLFIVKPEYRSNGIGKNLWYLRRNMLLSRLNPGASIGMDGVLAMQPFYAKGGFRIAFKDERYELVGHNYEISPSVSVMKTEDIEDVKAMDALCFGFERLSFLNAWLNLPEAQVFIYRNKELQGFAMVRKINKGYKIGPLFANDAGIAEELYKACLNNHCGQNVAIDIPMSNTAAVKLVKKYKADYVYECARMYYGQAPTLPLDKIFGITSFELG